MVKAILLDADGIVIQGRGKYFSEVLAEKNKFPIENFMHFLQNEYKKCILGQAKLEDEVVNYLESWKWTGSVEELLQYWFSHDGKPAQEVLDLVKLIREEGIKVYLTSDHSKYRENDIMENMKMKDYFDGAFFSCDLGATKEEAGFYQGVIKELDLEANDIMFWDDEKENVEAAEKAGLKASFYEHLEGFKEKLVEEGIL